MNSPDLKLYCSQMEEIKNRVAVVYSFIKGDSTVRTKVALIESACLQIRKILELIALSSLVANKIEFSKQNEKFAKLWNARLILNDIEKINPYFYPKPVTITLDNEPKITGITDENKFLSKEKFLKIYEKCGKLMHSDNPYGIKTSYDYFEKNIPLWLIDIMDLLENHLISLIDHKFIYLIKINDELDGKVHSYTLAPLPQ